MGMKNISHLAGLGAIASIAAALPSNGKSPLVARASSSTTPSSTTLVTWPAQTYVTENFTAPNLTITRHGNTAPGYLFFDPSGSGTTSQAALIMSDANELIWHGPDSDPLQQNNYQNFIVSDLDGQSVLSYWYGFSLATFGHGYGSVSILNQNYTELYNICIPNDILKINTGTNVTYPCNHDQHESYVTTKGTIITSAYNVTLADITSVGGPENGYVLSGVFHEIDIKTQEILFEWRSIDHLDQIPFSRSKQPLVTANHTYGVNSLLPWDYFHINSIAPSGDGGYIVNARHLFETYKISANGTIEWILNGETGGDFTLDPNIYFSWQHHPRIVGRSADNSVLEITYFNNDNSGGIFNGSNATTGLYLSVDQTAKHVSLVGKKLRRKAEPIWADSQGNTQTLPNNHTIMGYGQVPLIREYNKKGNFIYEAQFGPIGQQSGAAVSSYRAYRFEWEGYPLTTPSANATLSNGNLNVYMSWNGATEVTHWKVYAGTTTSGLRQLATIQKENFETRFTDVGYTGGATYVQVEALGRHKEVFGRSEVVAVTGS